MNSEDLLLSGFRKITDTPDAGMRDIRATWGGILAILLRKMVKDNYDGKGREGCKQWPVEDITYTQMIEIIEDTLQRYNGGTLTRAELKSEEARLLKEFSRDFLTIKFFGEFLNILDLEWADITVTVQRKSGTVKSYTQHIGGIGTGMYQKPEYNQEYFDLHGVHEDTIPKPESDLLRSKAIKKPKSKGNEDE